MQPRRHGGGMPPKKAKNTKLAFKKLVKFLRPFLPVIIITAFISIISSILSVTGPYVSRHLLNLLQRSIEDTVTTGNPFYIDFSAIWFIVTILIVIHITSFTLSTLEGIIMTNITQRMAKNLRTKIATKINKLPLKYLDNRNHGDVLSLTSNDVDTISSGVQGSITELLRSVSLVLTIGIFMFVISWQMALVAVLTVPLSIFVMRFIMKRSQKYFVKNQQTLGKLNSIIDEVYTGHDIVKIFNASEQMEEKFVITNEELAKTSWKSQFFSSIMMPTITFIGNISYIIAAVIGFLSGADVGDVFANLIYNRNFMQPLLNVSQSLSQLQGALAASERVFEFLEAEEMSVDSNSMPLDFNLSGNVEFKNVSFGYDPGKIIINDFSLSVKAGSKIAIVGPTGAGKTTLINLLMRFYEIDHGDIYFDGIDIKKIPRNDIAKNFSMVLQDTWLINASIKDNLIFNTDNISNERLKIVAKAAHIDHFIETLPKGYDTIINDEETVSQGQRQLFTIARAMLKNSPILILDEATSSVDTRTEILIQDAMDKLMKGRTSFVIAHRLSTIKNADLILVLNHGDIVEQGNHEELLAKNGFYTSLYNSQFEN